MIKIIKSSSIPDILQTEGLIETNKLKKLYENSPNDYTSISVKKNNKTKKFDFDNQIYANINVKNQLKLDQHNKCCFCESIFDANGYGDIEHFRPKAAYKLDNKLIYPAYYWLAYDWNNLMYSCQKCNQEFKRNEFPLLDENKRVKNHNSVNKIEDEEHTLINPLTEDPENFIYFMQEIPKSKQNLNLNDKIRADETIRVFGINRKELNRDRLEHLNMLKTLNLLANIDINNIDEIEKAIELFKISEQELIEKINNAKNICSNAIKKTSKFTAMIRSNFTQLK